MKAPSSTYRRPLAWINDSGLAAPTGGTDAHDSPRKVLGYVHARIIEGACLRLPLTRDSMETDGRPIPAQAHEQLTTTLKALTTEVRPVSETS